MLLGDLGADVVRVDRVGSVDDERRASDFLLRRGARSVAIDLAFPRRSRCHSAVGGGERRRHRRVATRRGGAARPRARSLPGPQPPSRLRPGDGLGPGRALRQCSGPRHQLHRRDRHPPRHGSPGHAARPSAQPRRRLRRRRHALCRRDSQCGAREPVSGRGQVIDAAMVDGSALLSTLFHSQRHLGEVDDERESNRLDGGAPWYDVYETAEGRYIAVAAGEPHFLKRCSASSGSTRISAILWTGPAGPGCGQRSRPPSLPAPEPSGRRSSAIRPSA